MICSGITIRSLCADEGMLLKRLRLGALKDSPDSFSPTFEETRQHDDEYWLRAAERIAESRGFDILIAEGDGPAMGLVSGQVDKEKVGHIGAMWVAPEGRRKGAGRKLLDGVMGFLMANHCNIIKLTVTETNDAAISVYKRAGFEFTGNDEPLRAGSSLKNLEMICPAGN